MSAFDIFGDSRDEVDGSSDDLFDVDDLISVETGGEEGRRDSW